MDKPETHQHFSFVMLSCNSKKKKKYIADEIQVFLNLYTDRW